jgi:hypothetical protein
LPPPIVAALTISSKKEEESTRSLKLAMDLSQVWQASGERWSTVGEKLIGRLARVELEIFTT